MGLGPAGSSGAGCPTMTASSHIVTGAWANGQKIPTLPLIKPRSAEATSGGNRGEQPVRKQIPHERPALPANGAGGARSTYSAGWKTRNPGIGQKPNVSSSRIQKEPAGVRREINTGLATPFSNDLLDLLPSLLYIYPEPAHHCLALALGTMIPTKGNRHPTAPAAPQHLWLLPRTTAAVINEAQSLLIQFVLPSANSRPFISPIKKFYPMHKRIRW